MLQDDDDMCSEAVEPHRAGDRARGVGHVDSSSSTSTPVHTKTSRTPCVDENSNVDADTNSAGVIKVTLTHRFCVFMIIHGAVCDRRVRVRY